MITKRAQISKKDRGKKSMEEEVEKEEEDRKEKKRERGRFIPLYVVQGNKRHQSVSIHFLSSSW
jgi:hypothetical protein